jgi:hypothetical protein
MVSIKKEQPAEAERLSPATKSMLRQLGRPALETEANIPQHFWSSPEPAYTQEK